MEKLSSMNKARVLSKAKEQHLSKEKILCLEIFALLMVIIAHEQVRLSLLNW